MLVGSGAIEFYASETYLTQDVDLVVERPPGTPIRERLATVFELLRFMKLSGPHWERDGMLVDFKTCFERQTVCGKNRQIF